METPKKTPYISGNRNPKKTSYISRNERKFLLLQESKPPKKFLYFLKRKLSLYFRKRKPRNGNSKKLLVFQEVTCKA